MKGLVGHLSGYPSAAGRAQDRESSPARDRRSTAVPRNQEEERHQWRKIAHDMANPCREDGWRQDKHYDYLDKARHVNIIPI